MSIEVKEIELAEEGEENSSSEVRVERIPEISIYAPGKNEDFLQLFILIKIKTKALVLLQWHALTS